MVVFLPLGFYNVYGLVFFCASFLLSIKVNGGTMLSLQQIQHTDYPIGARRKIMNRVHHFPNCLLRLVLV